MSDNMLDAVLSLHTMGRKTQCGAISIPLVHHHGYENDARPGPRRILRCTEDADHKGLHRDAVCCYNFQTFEDWKVADREPRVFDFCSCGGGFWPCPTIMAVQDAYAATKESHHGNASTL